MNSIEQRFKKQASESLEQAVSLLANEPDRAALLQNIRAAANQAAQAVSDLNVLYGLVLGSRENQQYTVLKKEVVGRIDTN